jgi:hypothetical protein
VILTAAVVAGTTWYLINEQPKGGVEANEERIQEIQEKILKQHLQEINTEDESVGQGKASDKPIAN